MDEVPDDQRGARGRSLDYAEIERLLGPEHGVLFDAEEMTPHGGRNKFRSKLANGLARRGVLISTRSAQDGGLYIALREDRPTPKQ